MIATVLCVLRMFEACYGRLFAISIYLLNTWMDKHVKTHTFSTLIRRFLTTLKLFFGGQFGAICRALPRPSNCRPSLLCRAHSSRNSGEREKVPKLQLSIHPRPPLCCQETRLMLKLREGTSCCRGCCCCCCCCQWHTPSSFLFSKQSPFHFPLSLFAWHPALTRGNNARRLLLLPCKFLLPKNRMCVYALLLLLFVVVVERSAARF